MAQKPNIDVPAKGDRIPEFVETAVFKRDVFPRPAQAILRAIPKPASFAAWSAPLHGGRSRWHGFWRDVKSVA